MNMMQKLVKARNGQAVTSSLQVAETFGKEHKHVLRDIDNLQQDVSNFGPISEGKGAAEFSADLFFETTYPDSYGREQRQVLMNRDGFTLLVMGFTGARALEFKLAYMNAFNQMEQELMQLQMGELHQTVTTLSSLEERRISAMEKAAEAKLITAKTAQAKMEQRVRETQFTPTRGKVIQEERPSDGGIELRYEYSYTIMDISNRIRFRLRPHQIERLIDELNVPFEIRTQRFLSAKSMMKVLDYIEQMPTAEWKRRFLP